MEALFVPLGHQAWGRFDQATAHVVHHDVRQPHDRDLIDLAWVETLLKGGDVYAVAADELPVDAPIAGLLRF
jgi:hypothetical protein